MRYKMLNYAFRCICWCGTVIILAYWIYLYSLDDDVCLVDYKKYYDTPDHSFPQLSLCVREPYLSSRLKTENVTIDPEIYSEFLRGQKFSSTLSKMRFSDILINANDYISRKWIVYRNGSSITLSVNPQKSNMMSSFFTGFFFQNTFFNCYTLKVPDDEEISIFSLEILNYMYPNGIRNKDLGLLILVHYQNQLLISSKSLSYYFPQREPNASYAMRFRVRGVELIKRRNKRSYPCYEEWDEHDSMIGGKFVESFGCRPPYFTLITSTSACASQDQMSNTPFNLRFDDYGASPPCQGMAKIDYTFEEADMTNTDWEKPGYFWAGLYLYDPKFKNIEQIQAIDINGLIGYIGGYVGLILGYNILQIPEYFTGLKSCLKFIRK